MQADRELKKKNLTAAVHNLGCKANAYETEAMVSMLRDAGYTIVPFDHKADIYVVNTCTVTNTADRKSRQMLHRARQMNPDALIVAVGCYVQTHRDTILQDGSVDLVIGTGHKAELIRMIRNASAQNSCISDVSRRFSYEELPIHPTQDRCRAFLKIQDGCDQFCSYCAIPLARGRVRSRKPENVLREARMLAESGFKEIVLTGIHLCSYGKDFEDTNRKEHANMDVLLDLIGELAGISGISRIRLGSLEPGSMTRDVIRNLSQIPQVCPHFHLSLQSGSNHTLARMNRRYTTEQFREVCDMLRSFYKEPVLTTDIIVGFPGEDKSEFDQTCAFLKDIHFYHTHIFKYSKRDGTRAASMSDQIPEQIKTERSRLLGQINAEMKEYYKKRFEGKSVQVLTEERVSDHEWTGHTAEYLKVSVFKSDLRENELYTGVIGKEIRITD